MTSLESIGRYLLQSSKKSIILQPISETSINCYVDADFAHTTNAMLQPGIDAFRARASFSAFVYHFLFSMVRF